MPSAPKVSLGFPLDGVDTRRWKTWAKKQTQRPRSMNGTCIQGGAFWKFVLFFVVAAMLDRYRISSTSQTTAFVCQSP